MVIAQKPLRVVQDSGKEGEEVGLGTRNAAWFRESCGLYFKAALENQKEETLTRWLGLR